MNKIRRGDVVIMDLPFDKGSHIQGGKRPWVVLQNDTGNASSPCTIVAPLTTKIQRLDIPSHVPMVWKGIRPSMIQCEQVRVVDNREDEWQFLCHLPPEIMEHIDTALMAAFFFTPPAERGGDRHGN